MGVIAKIINNAATYSTANTFVEVKEYKKEMDRLKKEIKRTQWRKGVKRG